MIDLVIDPRDPELVPLGPSGDGSRYRPVQVTVATSRDVRLVAGGFVLGGAKVDEQIPVGGSLTVSVPATDGAEILEADRSTFEYVVTLTWSRVGKSRDTVTRTFRGLLPTSLGPTVQVTELVNSEPLPAPYTSIQDIIDGVADVNDPVVASLVGTSSSTRTALDGRYPKKGDIVTHVRDYGAVGDGTTNDTAAIQAAVNAVQAAGGGTVQFDPKTYVVTSVDIQAGLTINGNGATLKRPASQPNWTRTLTNQTRYPAASSTDAAPITIRNITLDGNRANQGAYTSFQLEQSMLLFIGGNVAGAGRQVAVLDDVTFKECVSDGLHVFANADVTARNLRAENCWRGGLVASGGHSVLRVNGYRGYGSTHGAHIDQEIDSPGFGGSKRCDVSLSDAVVDTPMTYTKSNNITAYDGSRVVLTRCEFMSGVSIYGPSGDISVSDSTFHTWQAAAYNSLLTVSGSFTRCKFIGHTAGGLSTRRILNVSPLVAGQPDVERTISFNECEWTVADFVGGDLWEAVYVESVSTPTPPRFAVYAKGGRVGPNITNGFRLSRGGTLVLDNRIRFESTRMFLLTGVTGEGRLSTVVVGQVDIAPTCTAPYGFGNNDAGNVIRHVNTLVDESQTTVYAPSSYGSTTFLGTRTVEVAAAPTATTQGFRGDKARLKTPTAGAVAEWVCTATGTTTAVWKAATTLSA